jgi:aromatic ring-opening dioxygenase catalytic subunit (LigB family)
MMLGRAIRRAIDSFPGAERVAVVGTGGMSHQLQGERAGLINLEFDLAYMDQLRDDPEATAEISHTEIMREAGSEGIELVMWQIARGALDSAVEEKLRINHVPTSNTSNGVFVLENA